MHLFDNMTYHDYFYNPDANYDRVGDLRRILDKYAPSVKLRQGENGSPTFKGEGRGAIGDYDWSELSQAKWNTRRLLGDLGHDMESSILGIIDMNYAVLASPIKKMNVKGLLMADTNQRVVRPRIVYYAMQNVAAIFDDKLLRIKDLHDTHNANAKKITKEVSYNKGTDRSLAVYAYEDKKTKKQLFTIWMNEYIPTNKNEIKNINFTVINGNFEQPVYVDIITGGVYEIPANQWRKEGTKFTFTDMPIYDAPILIADKSLLQIK